MDLSIVIINFNTDELLEKCLESIGRHAKGLTFEVIVVNNGTSDPSAIVKRFSFARVIQAENRGFSAGNNAGAVEAKGEILLFLNSDTELLTDNLREAVAQFQADPDLGLLVPHLQLPTGEPQAGSYGQLPTVLSMIREKLKMESDSDPDGPVEWVTGAALFIPRKIWKRLGGWDEHYFMYMEDVDLGARAVKAGLKAAYFPELRIVHRVGSSISKSMQRKRYFRESQNYYFRKHHGRVGEWIMRVLRLPYRLSVMIRPKW